MKLFTSILLIFTFRIGFAQIYFNENFDLGHPHCVFGSVIVTDSCYYVNATTFEENGPPSAAIEFTKINLDGTLNQHKLLNSDTYGMHGWQESKMIQTLDGNFAHLIYMKDHQFSPAFPLFVKYNANGDTIQSVILNEITENNTIEAIWNLPLIQNNDSTYYGVTAINGVNNPPRLTGFAIYKLDANGHYLWHKKYFQNDLPEFLGSSLAPFSLMRYNDSTLIVGCTEYHVNLPSDIDDRFYTKLFVLDTLGDVRQEIIDSTKRFDYAVKGLSKTRDKGLIYGGVTGRWVNGSNGTQQWKNTIVKLDSNFNTQWRIAPKDYDYGALNQTIYCQMVRPINDSEYVAIGNEGFKFESDSTTKHTGWLLKFNDEGDVLWQRHYYKVPTRTTASNPNLPSHYFYDVQPTPDGGFVMAGQTVNPQTTMPDHPYGRRGWLIKVDEFGCMMPGCQLPPPSGVVLNPPIYLYPNPVSSELFYYHNSETDSLPSTIYIFNYNGQLMQEFRADLNQTTYIIDVIDYAAGTYIFKVVDANGVNSKTEKFVVVH